MPVLPLPLSTIRVPPIKCQGIKTRLVPFIASQIQWQPNPQSRWIEPFLGSGVVAFNLCPDRALLADSNRHIIQFYQAIQQCHINRDSVRQFLVHEGQQLCRYGADYYYEVRDRFNQTSNSLDFLFLNRACFNGLMRFNRHGSFNVPFCHKPQRFSQSYITKIANQVHWVAQQLRDKDWEFRVAPWTETLQATTPQDFVYLDPPYIGRHTDYFNQWEQADAETLAAITQRLPCGFAVSMWLANQHRHNGHIQTCWPGTEQRVCQHFYHVGAKETWRGAIAEALLIKPGYAAPLTNDLPICPSCDARAIAPPYPGSDERLIDLIDPQIMTGKKKKDELQHGDRVQWNTSNGKTDGTIEQKLTAPTDIKGHHVAASEDNPEYLVKSRKSGKKAAHKPEALQKLED